MSERHDKGEVSLMIFGPNRELFTPELAKRCKDICLQCQLAKAKDGDPIWVIGEFVCKLCGGSQGVTFCTPTDRRFCDGSLGNIRHYTGDDSNG